jgi:Helix-turn-helix domain
MAAKLGLEARMAIRELARRQVSQSEIARKLGVQEGTIRYHLRRMAAGATDGRAQQTHLAVGWRDVIDTWLAAEVGRAGALNLAALHNRLVEKHGYAGKLQSLQRYFHRHYPPPPRRGPSARGDAARSAGPGGLGGVSRRARRRHAPRPPRLSPPALAFPLRGDRLGRARGSGELACPA